MGMFDDDFGVDMSLQRYCKRLNVQIAHDQFGRLEEVFGLKYPKRYKLTQKQKTEFFENHIRDILFKCDMGCFVQEISYSGEDRHEYPGLYEQFKPHIKDLIDVSKKFYYQSIQFFIESKKHKTKKNVLFNIAIDYTDEGHKIMKELTKQHYS